MISSLIKRNLIGQFHAENEQPLNVFIVGSGPKPIWPDAKPDIVFAANGAISQSQTFYKKCPLVSVLAKKLLQDDPKTNISSSAKILDGCNSDVAFLTGNFRKTAVPDLIPIQRGMNTDRTIAYDKYKPLWAKLKQVGLAPLCYEFKKIMTHPWKEIRQIRKERSFRSLQISTGLLALCIAMETVKGPATFFLIGITANEQTLHFYDNKIKFRGHAEQDFLFLKLLVKKNQRHRQKRKVVITDPMLQSRICHEI